MYAARHSAWACRPLLLTALTAFSCFWIAPVRAVSLGELQGNPRVGEFLQVRIPVLSTPGEGISAECFRLAGPINELSDDIPWLHSGQLRLISDGSRMSLQVTSSQPVTSPALMLAIRVSCGASLRREYTLLLNPPPAGENVAIAPLVPAVAPTQSSSAPSVPTLRTRDGETLRSIGLEMFPEDSALQARYLRALRERNPERLGAYRDTDPLPGGLDLVTPDPASVAAAPAAPAARPRAQRPAPDATPARPPRDDSPRKRRERKPHLIVGGDGTALQLATGLSERKQLSDAERGRLRTELQLIATLDEKITTQMELSEKLRQLEAIQLQLQSDVQTLESRIREQQIAIASGSLPLAASAAVPAPIKAAPKAKLDETNVLMQRWLLPMIAGALLLVIVVLVIALVLRYRRWRADRAWSEDSLESLVSAADTEPQQLPDNLFEPLTEEDIWPDRAPADGAQPSLDDELPTLSHSELGPASVLHIEDDVEEHDSAVELAEIMMSFGRVQGAAQTLADYIRANPKQAVKPWVKLLEVYKAANMRTEFDALSNQLNKTFNVKPTSWDDFDVAMRAPESIEDLPHLKQQLCELWGKRECQSWLHQLLRDNRQGTRQGFPLAIVDEILMLLGVLEAQLGAWKAGDPVPTQPEPTLRSSEVPPLDFPEISAPPTLPTPHKPNSSTDISTSTHTNTLDFELDDSALTSTLHINLDELQPDTGYTPERTRFEPHPVNPAKDEDQDTDLFGKKS